ncbi:single-strand selective monofunctional uracil DNA glycosylase [Gammaproteobacteria bacterium]
MSDLIDITKRLADEVEAMTFSAPVSHVYNPLRYAWAPHAEYLTRYGKGHKEVLLLGMNPGPFGMAQTGVPFGEVDLVRNWLGIEAPVSRPRYEHPKRPVEGFACRRHEVSGQRLWSWAREGCGTPERFFARFFVINYCPLVFMEESGRNRTPDKLPMAEREALFARCDHALAAMVETLGAQQVIGVGRFAADRAASALTGRSVAVVVVPHPSPANPAANQGWARLMDTRLTELGITLPCIPTPLIK